VDTIKIKAFLLTAKYKSFSRAAQDLSYTPSALSHIADSLEHEIGVKLFDRSRHGVGLTEAGEYLYEKFAAVLEAEEKLYKAAAALSENRERSLKIGTYSSIALHVLPRILHSFKQAYPMVDTQILVDDHMHNWLENGTADLILADDTLAQDNYHPLMEDEYVAVVPKGEFANRKVISLDELYAHSFIRPNEAYLDNFFTYSNFKEVIRVSSIENDSIVYMVKENIGVTVLPKLSMSNCPAEVKVLKLKPRLSRTIGIAYNKRNCTWACEQFVRHITKGMR